MGAKTALLAFTDRLPALSDTRSGDRAAAEQLVRQVYPGRAVTAAGDADLVDRVNPPRELTFAATVGGTALLCDWALVLDRPSRLPAHVLALGAGRRIVMHGMHSVVDWLCFAVWDDGHLVRSLSLSPDGGIVEDLGRRLDFEAPYWAGERALEPDDDFDEPYPLPFHPLELGEDALAALFGFVLEGVPDDSHVDLERIRVHGFRVEGHGRA